MSEKNISVWSVSGKAANRRSRLSRVALSQTNTRIRTTIVFNKPQRTREHTVSRVYAVSGNSISREVSRSLKSTHSRAANREDRLTKHHFYK